MGSRSGAGLLLTLRTFQPGAEPERSRELTLRIRSVSARGVISPASRGRGGEFTPFSPRLFFVKKKKKKMGGGGGVVCAAPLVLSSATRRLRGGLEEN